jgi:hypothetical protein
VAIPAIQLIVPNSTIEKVIAGLTVQEVISDTAVDAVVPARAGKDVVSFQAIDELVFGFALVRSGSEVPKIRTLTLAIQTGPDVFG